MRSGRFGLHCRLWFRRWRRRRLDGEFLVTGLRAHLARGFTEKDAGASRPLRFGANYQSDLKWRGEVAEMDLAIAFGKKDPAAEMRMIPAQRLQTLQAGVSGGSRDEILQPLLILFR
jgi:hypothetical protein